ncbi:MAG: outer membrane lipoprotein-sorting protein [Magnetococcales bacterium]|nr:outer membrane lipoprotein-sorting protein [Magnetococcales bacterium]
MKKRFLLQLVVVSVFGLLSVNSSGGLAYAITAAELSGQAIMATATKKQFHPFEYEQITITRTNADGTRFIRKGRRYSRREQGEGAVNKHVLVLDYPKPIQGVAFLVKQMANGIQGHWVYLPALKARMRRIVGSGSSGVFDTDFTIEDIANEDTSRFIYTRQKDLTFQKKLHFIIDARPKNSKVKSQSGYGHRRIYIDRKQYKISRIDYFDKSGKLIKQLTNKNSNTHNDSGLVWRPGYRRMENKIDGTHTTIKTTRRLFNKELVPKAIFSRQEIAKGILLEQNHWNPKQLRAKTPLEALFDSAAKARPNKEKIVGNIKPQPSTITGQQAEIKHETPETVVLQPKAIVKPTTPAKATMEPLPKTTATPKPRLKQADPI